MSKFRKGNIIKATVTGIENYGVFVSSDEYYTGLIHISEISNGFVKDINDYVKIGDIISVKILDIDDEEGHLKLSIKNIDYKKIRNFKRHKIKETSLGFKTLAYRLPIWIKDSMENIKNSNNN